MLVWHPEIHRSPTRRNFRPFFRVFEPIGRYMPQSEVACGHVPRPETSRRSDRKIAFRIAAHGLTKDENRIYET